MYIHRVGYMGICTTVKYGYWRRKKQRRREREEGKEARKEGV